MESKTRVVNEERFLAYVQVCTSPMFYRWVFGFNGEITIIRPSDVKNAYRKQLENGLKKLE